MILSLLQKIFVSVAHAQTLFDDYCTTLHPTACGVGSGFGAAVALRVGNFFAALVGGAAAIAIMYGGIKLMSAGGNEQGKEEAKKIITVAVIGLILAIMAEGFIIFVVNFVEGFAGFTPVTS